MQEPTFLKSGKTGSTCSILEQFRLSRFLISVKEIQLLITRKKKLGFGSKFKVFMHNCIINDKPNTAGYRMHI